MSKTIQVRMNEQEHTLIKTAFAGENLSKIIREFLHEEAEKRLKNSDMSLQQNDSSIQHFVDLLSNPDVQKMLYKIFKAASVEDFSK